MHKKPVLQGCGSGAQWRSRRAGARPGTRASGGVTGGVARRLTLALGMLYCLGQGPGSAGRDWQWGPRAAWADGDPIAPPGEANPNPVAPTAPAAAPSLSPSAPASQPAQPAQPAPAGVAPAPAPAVAAPATSPDAASREERFRDLERRTFELKDQVFRAKARLTLLSETLVSANVGTTRAVLVHQNQMGRLFQPIRVSYQLDGRELITKEDPAGVIGEGKELVMWEGGLKPGEHTVGVTVVYRGNGAKVFAYYDKYNFTARAAHRLTAVEGQTTRLIVRCYEKGTALTAKLEDRPEFEFKVAGNSAPVRAASDGKPAADKLVGKRPDDQSTEAKAK